MNLTVFFAGIFNTGISLFTFIGLAAIITVLLVLAGYNIYTLKRKLRKLNREKTDEKNHFELMVAERTKTLEKIRDSISEYAIQKYELAQELEVKNQEINRQKDNLAKQAEQLKTAYDEIKRVEAFRQQMSRMLVHDLKNPLNTIINVAEKSNIQTDSARLIKKLSWGLLDLIQNLLEVNKLESSKMKIHLTEFDLASLLSGLFNKFSFLLQNSSVELRIQIPSGYLINADRQLTERILDNLISNAIKYTQPGGIITVSASSENEKVKICVSDTGKGIPDDIRNEVFNEYVQGEHRSFAYTSSTGIGLTFCRLAAEAQEGEIGIETERDKGTTVWFTVRYGSIEKKTADISIEETILSDHSLQPAPEDLFRIHEIVEEMKILNIHDASSILRFLSDKVFNSSPGLRNWKKAVEDAVFTGNEEQFRTLTGIL